MARVERVGDPADPRLRDFTDLRDVQLRSAREPAEGLFLAEGERTIRRALDAGYRPRAALTTERWLEGVAEALGEAAVYVVDDDVLARTVGFPVHRGALASFERRPLPRLEALLGRAGRLVVLEDLADHTNVGAIFRSAAALGWDGVLLTPRSADPLYRRAVRTSMGAVFSVPWTRIDWREGPGILHAAGVRLLALTPSPDAAPIAEVSAVAPLALVLGAEDPGVSARWSEGADERVRIPMWAGVDSLNVAAAAAVALHALGPRATGHP
ncbi:MAG: TrmH family RNA methyltransferase [Planctomycetaceae bacterium]